MTLTFLHTADWQIGKPYNGYQVAAPFLTDARLSVIDRIAAVAIQENARHVLVAGDVFDSVTAPRELLAKFVNHLKAHAGLVWHLLPGNHDPVQAGSLWHPLAALTEHSQHIQLHLTPQPIEIESGAWLLPAPLKAKAMHTDPTAYMDVFETPPGALRIGMAHGSAAAFGTSGDAQVPISPTRDKAARLDYLALGDWHGRTRISDRIYYSGTPEPDRFKDNEPGQTLAVTISAAGAKPDVRTHRTALFQWLDRAMTLESAADLAVLSQELERLGAPSTPVMLQLRLAGRVMLSEHGAITEAAHDIGALAKHFSLDQSQLQFHTDVDALDSAFSGSLRVVADRLVASQVMATPEAQRIATRALQTLSRLARSAAP